MLPELSALLEGSAFPHAAPEPAKQACFFVFSCGYILGRAGRPSDRQRAKPALKARLRLHCKTCSRVRHEGQSGQQSPVFIDRSDLFRLLPTSSGFLQYLVSHNSGGLKNVDPPVLPV